MGLKFWKRERKVKEPLVSAAFLQGLGNHHPHTPDFWDIVTSKDQLVFVADEMMAGHRCNDMVAGVNGERKAVAYTAIPFVMFKLLHGKATFPVIMHKNVTDLIKFRYAVPARVKGELYKVKSEQLIELDNWKENGKIFRRERVYLDIPYQEVHEDRYINKYNQGLTRVVREHTAHVINAEWKHDKTQDAWVYVGIGKHFFWSHFADQSFVPMKPKVPQDANLTPFYYYTNKEDAK